MIKTIALNGDIKGSVKLKERNKGTEYELRLMQPVKLPAEAKMTFSLVLVSDRDIRLIGADPYKPNGFAEIVNVKGFAIASFDNRIVSEGYVSLNRNETERYRERIRLILARKRSNDSSEDKGADTLIMLDPPAIAAESGHGRSPITVRILSQARELFYGGPEETKLPYELNKIRQEELNDRPYVEIPNPFPKKYPNSSWRRRIGNETTSGVAYSNGRKLYIEAQPYRKGSPLKMQSGQKNTAFGIDGIMYQLYFRRK